MEQMAFKEKYKGREKVKTMQEFQSLFEETKADSHDYGAIVEACALMMNAAFNLLDPGITGFQAGCLMWMMVEKYGMYGKDAMLQITDYANVMFPQYEYKFTSIPKSYWSKIQEQAKEKLIDFKGHPNVKAHLESVASGKIPFGLRIGDE